MSTFGNETRSLERQRWINVALGVGVVVAVAVCGAVGILTALGVPLLVEVLRHPNYGVC